MSPLQERFAEEVPLPRSIQLHIVRFTVKILLDNSSVTADDAAQAAAQRFRSPHAPGRWVLRTVFIWDGDAWVTLAAVLRTVPAGQDWATTQDIRMGSLRLNSRRITSSELRDGGALLSLFLDLPSVSDQEDGFYDTAHPSREWSRNNFSEEPCWRIDWAPKNRRSLNMPRGPFLNASHGLFFEEVGRAAAAWTGDTTLLNRNGGEILYRMIVPDTRAMFEDVISLDAGVDVRVRSTMKRALWVAAACDGSGGTRFDLVQPVRAGQALLVFPDRPRRLTLYLLDAESACYDKLDEFDYRPTPGASLYSAEHREAASLQADLDEARRRGEGPEIEFKEWFVPDRGDKKSEELIRTAVAFANTRGGSAYIGVNDVLEVVGIHRDLERQYGKVGRGDPLVLRSAYEEALRRWIVEGVRPSIDPEFAWIEQAGLLVLRIRIWEGAHKPYQLAQKSEVYVRRGSRNTRPEPGEVVPTEHSGVVRNRWWHR